MRQAIVTKYLGLTYHRGARISCKAQVGRLTFPWDHALDVAENHLKAATAFAWRWGWTDTHTLVGGAMPDDTGYCFVMVPRNKNP